VLDAGDIVRHRVSAAIERRDYVLTSYVFPTTSSGLMTSSGFLTSRHLDS
jgi:hypothetical protein